MFCPNCGQQIADNSKFCQHCGTVIQTAQAPTQPMQLNSVPAQPPIQQPTPQPVQPVKRRKRWYARWWVWVIIGVVGTAVIANIGKRLDTTSTSANPNSSVTVTKPNATSKPVATIAPAAEEENEYYTVGESYEAKGLKITIDSCEEYVNDNEYYQPDDGNVYIRAKITIENTSNTDKSVGTGLFDCYVDNAIIDREWLVGDDDLTIYDSISPGRSVTGYLYYEVPKDAGSIELEFSPSYWSTSKRVVYKLK